MIAGRYELGREIGRGGMGAVWLAHDTTLGREVAVKRLGLVPGGDAAGLERAAREARLAARLNHPHVVHVFDLVNEDAGQWLVMEYVEGQTLAAMIRTEGAMSPDRASGLLGQAADALAAAHAAGIVHRDVKPSNMLVGGNDDVKLSDFGIARAEADPSLTQTGLVTGSPAYLSPEVASGRTATTASDVWSLGATLYHALSGQPPYEVGDNLMGALYRIVHEEPPRLADAGWLAPLLEATMTTEPGDRWSMAQVRDFLHSHGRVAAPVGGETTQVMTAPVAPAPVAAAPVAAAPEPTPTPVEPAAAPVSEEPRRRRSWLPIAIAAALVLVLGALAWVLLGGDDGTTPTIDRPSASAGDGGGGGRWQQRGALRQRVVLPRAGPAHGQGDGGLHLRLPRHGAELARDDVRHADAGIPGRQRRASTATRATGPRSPRQPRSRSTPIRRTWWWSTPSTTPVRTAPRRPTRSSCNCNTRTANI